MAANAIPAGWELTALNAAARGVRIPGLIPLPMNLLRLCVLAPARVLGSLSYNTWAPQSTNGSNQQRTDSKLPTR